MRLKPVDCVVDIVSRGRSFLTAALLLGIGALWNSPAAVICAQGPDGGEQRSADSGTPIDLQSLETRIQQTLKKVTPSVVSVSGGSGVVISEDGYILTVAHVGSRAGRNVTVYFSDGRSAKAKTLGNDSGVDAGLMKITDEGPWPFSERGDSGDLKQGQWCLALGYPVSFERSKRPAVRVGRVLRSEASVIITDCTIMGGDSGGPLFDLDGKVIGISSRCNDHLSFNVHVPVNQYHDKWERLAKSEDFNSRETNLAFLGIVPEEEGDEMRIAEVFPGTAAEKAGMEQGDKILRFAGEEVQEFEQLLVLIQKRDPGDKVEIEVLRGDETLKLNAVLGSRSG